MVIQFKYCFLIKRQSGECTVGNFLTALVYEFTDVQAFKVRVFTRDFKF